MRTTLSIDDAIIHQVMTFTGENNPVNAIRHALQDYLAQQRKIKLLALRGQVQIEDNWAALRQLDQLNTAPCPEKS
jgi:hypothetical protein